MKVLLAGIFCAITVVSVSAQGVRPSVSVVGNAQMKIAPDQVVFTFAIVTFNKDLTASKQENDARSAKTLATTKSFAIDSNDVQTDSLVITPRYTAEKDPCGANLLLGYEVAKRIIITLKNLQQIDAFVGKAIESGVNNVVAISIENSQLPKYQEQVRAMAVKNAETKARAYAAELGQTIGKAYVIREEDADAPAYDVGRGGGNGNGDGLGSGDNAFIPDSRPLVFDRQVTFALGKIEVSEKVFAIFELNR